MADRQGVEIRWRVFTDKRRVRGCKNERAGWLEVWVVLPQHFPGKLLTPTPYSREKERPEEHPSPLILLPAAFSLKSSSKTLGNKEKMCAKRKVLYSKSTISFQFFFLPLFFFCHIVLFLVPRTEGLVAGTLQVHGAPGDFSLIASQTNRGTCSPAQRLDGIGAFALRSITAHSRTILPFFNASLK